MKSTATLKTTLVAPFLTLLSIYNAPSMAAGFDCKQAQTEIEISICGDPLLSSLDGELSRTYWELIKTTEAESKENLVLEQRYWLKEIRNRCSSNTCLLEAYSSRLSSFMPSACPSRNKEYEFTESEITASRERQENIASHICAKLHYLTDSALTEELISGFNQGLNATGRTQEISSCQRILEVEQVRTKGYSRSYKSYGAICQVGKESLMLCDYPMVGKFTLSQSFTSNTSELVNFTLTNCPLGG